MLEVDVFLGIGSNLGNSTKNVISAINKLKESKNIIYIQHSKLYQTTAVNCIVNKDFVNAVCHIRTKLNPEKLFEIIELIEKDLGKVKKAKNEPRVIDIDILLYGDQKYESNFLTIPHPEFTKRLFVLIPLSDLVDEILLPVKGKSFSFRLKDYISNFVNSNNEKIKVIENA